MCLVGVKGQEKQQFGDWGINSGGLIAGSCLQVKVWEGSVPCWVVNNLEHVTGY